MLPFILIFLITFAAVVFLYSLISRRLEGTLVTAPMVFVVAGLLFSPAGVDWVDTGTHNSAILVIAQVALVLTLFSDASRINFRALRKGASLPIRLLIIGLPLTVLFGGLVAAGLFTGITIAEAALAGSMLAPTDASLGQAIVTSKRIPERIRQTLNVESGLNDGGTLPFFYFFLFLAAATFLGIPERSWLQISFSLIGIGIITGILAGYGGNRLMEAARRGGWITGTFRWIGFLSLALIAWIGAEALGGSGFIAAFVAGLTVAAMRKGEAEESELAFTEAGGELLNLAVFFILGLIAPLILPGITGMVVLYAILSLTIIRMIPVAVSLIGTGLDKKTVLFIGWFGPRGLASIVLLLIVLEEAPAIPGMATIQMIVVTTILASIFAHGISAAPLMRRYAKVVESLPPDSPELQEAPAGPAP